MDRKVLKFLNKTKIKPTDIAYFIHEERRTVIHLTNGETLSTYIPMKYLLAAMPHGTFLNITKGVVVSAAEIAHIDGATYTMRDGTQFIGRKRGAGEHKTNRRILEDRVVHQNRVVTTSIVDRFSGFDKSPLEVIVMEMVLNTAGAVEDFVLRYCNQAFLDQVGFGYKEVIDHSFFAVLPYPKQELFLAYGDVAKEGIPQAVRMTDVKTHDRIVVHCFQPLAGYCAAIKVIEKDSKLSARRIDE